jgi:hypothetical protein
MRTARLVFLSLFAMMPRSGPSPVAPDAPALVTLLRVPHGGIQPQAAVDSRGVLHLLYFAGEPRGGNLFYVRSPDYGQTFSAPIRVNSQNGSAIAIGTIRGGQLAVGRDGRVHVAWNGSDTASPRGLINPSNAQPSAPFLYTRSNAEGTAFEPQRNLTRRSYGLDGGGSIAADAAGHVYAAWHAQPAGGVGGEDHRAVWVARSTDDGATFGDEQQVSREPTGACSCCGVTLAAGPGNRLYLLYRSATSLTHRDIYLLGSDDKGLSFHGSRVQPWDIAACPMTSMSVASADSRVIAAWETAGQVYRGEVDRTGTHIPSPVAAPGEGANRKHPRIAANASGGMLFLWTEGTAWARGGSLAWQVLDAAGRPAASTGTVSGVPVWSFGAAAARPDGGFVVFY